MILKRRRQHMKDETKKMGNIHFGPADFNHIRVNVIH